MKDALATLLIPTDEDVHCGISLHQPLTAAIHLPVEPFPLEGRVKDQKPVEAAVGGKQMLSEFAENGVDHLQEEIGPLLKEQIRCPLDSVVELHQNIGHLILQVDAEKPELFHRIPGRPHLVMQKHIKVVANSQRPFNPAEFLLLFWMVFKNIH